MKKSKADQKKIVARYIAKFEEYSKLSSEELVALQDTKMSSTDSIALRDSINQKMKEEIMNQRLKNAEEKGETIPGQGLHIDSEQLETPIIDLSRTNEGNKEGLEEANKGENNTIKEESKDK